MPEFGFQSRSEQVAAYLREQLFRGRWSDTMPGMARISEALGVDHKTVMAALHLLEQEGLLVPQGPGKRRKIVLPYGEQAPLRIAYLPYERIDAQQYYTIDFYHRLKEAGHAPFYADRSQTELKFSVPRVRRLVEQIKADAWIVNAGSNEVLEWFSQQAPPVFAFFGRMEGLPIAGVKPDKAEAYATVIRRLVEFGHRRIVLLCRTERRLPEPGRSERAYLDTLEALGIEPGKYNLPDWEDTAEGFQAILTSLFQITPPTAVIASEAFLFTVTQQFLSHRGIRVPEDVSLICTDNDPTFAWCEPSIAHITWDSRPVVRRVVRWADNISRGQEDLRQTLTKAEFVAGGTMGPALMCPE